MRNVSWSADSFRPRAASRRPAAHPPVRRCRSSTCRGVSRSPEFCSSAAASGGVKDSWAARSSWSPPFRRSRGSDSGGSSLLARTSRMVAGLTRMKVRRVFSVCGSSSCCTSSRISRIGWASSCSAAASSARKSGCVAGLRVRVACSGADGGSDGQAVMAARIADHSRGGSLSSRSMLTQAVSVTVVVRAQSASSRVFP